MRRTRKVKDFNFIVSDIYMIFKELIKNGEVERVIRPLRKWAKLAHKDSIDSAIRMLEERKYSLSTAWYILGFPSFTKSSEAREEILKGKGISRELFIAYLQARKEKYSNLYGTDCVYLEAALLAWGLDTDSSKKVLGELCNESMEVERILPGTAKKRYLVKDSVFPRLFFLF